MRRRFNVNEHGELADRNGYVLGKITSLTIDMPSDAIADLEVVGDVCNLGDPEGRNLRTPETDPLYRQTDVTAVDVSGVDVEGGLSPVLSKTQEKSLRTQRSDRGSGDPIARIWAFYVETMKPRRKTIDPQSRTLIREALKIASEAECLAAIRGCRKSRHHMGDNDRGKKYNTLSHILRGKRGIRTSREQIDLMLSYDEASEHGELPSEARAEILADKRTVRQYAPFTKNAQAQQMAQAAMDKLTAHGIQTTIDARSNGLGCIIAFSDEQGSASTPPGGEERV